MKRITVNLENISDVDLKFARNPKVVALLDEIIPLSLDERSKALEELRAKIQQGQASLFEEHVKVSLYIGRKAEWIRVIYKNLSHIEAELSKRAEPKTAPVVLPQTLPVPRHSASAQPSAPFVQKSHSELLEFLSTQKPPTQPKPPASSRKNGKKASSEKSSAFRFRLQDVLVAGLMVVLVIVVMLRGKEGQDPTSQIDTFYDQTHEQRHENGVPRELQDQIEADFDAADHRELRFGEFQQGETALLHIAATYPVSEYAESAYIMIADAYRTRRNDPDTALQYYQQFLEKFPESRQYAVTQLKIGFVHEDMADTMQARDLYRQLIQRYGEQSRVGQLAYERLQRLNQSSRS